MSRWSAIRQGFVDTIVVWPGVAPFGMVYAVSALAAGLSIWETLGMSLIVFAGASQFTAVGLFGSGANPWTIIATTAIINARHLLLAASTASYIRRAPTWLRALVAFQLTDETYAVGIQHFAKHGGDAWYQFGSNLSLYVVWAASTVIGSLLGALIPDPGALGLDLIFPLTFIAFTVPLLRDRINRVVAGLAAVISVGTALILPGSWYVLSAGILASAVGALLARRSEPVVQEGV
ncbi:MAG: AzlC family ABC transporter permease [Roseiflexaceae bacterium]|jgi:4-azaleucine resistance transporter AzlC|nr:AzlC family ABC transporter permease [Chloroflexaceae bacterium]